MTCAVFSMAVPRDDSACFYMRSSRPLTPGWRGRGRGGGGEGGGGGGGRSASPAKAISSREHLNVKCMFLID